MKTIVLGPPGTGKTHTLLNEVDKCLKQTDPYSKSCIRSKR